MKKIKKKKNDFSCERLTQNIEANHTQEKKDVLEVSVRVISNRITDYTNTPRLIAVVAAQEEKSNFKTKIAFFQSSYPEFDLATNIHWRYSDGQWIRQTRTLSYPASRKLAHYKNPRSYQARFTKIKETLLGFLNDKDGFLLSEPM